MTKYHGAREGYDPEKLDKIRRTAKVEDAILPWHFRAFQAVVIHPGRQAAKRLKRKRVSSFPNKRAHGRSA